MLSGRLYRNREVGTATRVGKPVYEIRITVHAERRASFLFFRMAEKLPTLLFMRATGEE